MQSTKFQVYDDCSLPLVTAQLPLRLAPGKAGIFLETYTGKPMTAQLSILHPQEAVGRAQERGAKLTPNSCTTHTRHTFASMSPISPPGPRPSARPRSCSRTGRGTASNANPEVATVAQSAARAPQVQSKLVANQVVGSFSMKTVLAWPGMNSAGFIAGCTTYRHWSRVATKLNIFIKVGLATFRGTISDMCLLDTCPTPLMETFPFVEEPWPLWTVLTQNYTPTFCMGQRVPSKRESWCPSTKTLPREVVL